MKRYIAPKESNSADLLDVFLYIGTYVSHTYGQGILWSLWCFWCFFVFYIKQYISYASIRLAFFVICMLVVYCFLRDLGSLLSWGTAISWWCCLSGLGRGLEPFRMEGFSSHLPHAHTPPAIFSITVPVVVDDISQYRVSFQERGEF